MNTEKLAQYFDSQTRKPIIHEALLYCETLNGGDSWCKSYGNKTLDTPMLAASITKLFTTACIFRLCQDEKITLDDNISDYLDHDVVQNIHTYEGKDYACALTIRKLLCQTSGLPDYYLAGRKSIYQQVKEHDFSYSFEDAIHWTKSLPARFIPSTGNRAYYADINFDLLGKIIEKATGLRYHEACEQFIFEKLSLKHTFVASQDMENIPYLYYKNEKIKRNQFISSCYASGGIITTAQELMTFLKAFWSGALFDKSLLLQVSDSNRLQLSFYPIQYAGGYMKIKASFPFSKKLTLVGHSGSTGSFAFYCVEKGLFLVGDIPQIMNPSLPIRFVMNAALRVSFR